MADSDADVRWHRVNDEPFEYAIQQGPHGDEFIKLINGGCLRRSFSDIGTPAGRSWRMAEQYFRDGDDEVGTKSYNDGYVMTIKMDGHRTRQVFFDPAGRITHVR